MIRDLVAAHALRFESPARAPIDRGAAARLLVSFLVVGLILQPGLRALARLFGFGDLPATPLVIIVTLIVIAILAVRRFAGLELAAIGLHSWKSWTRREKLYLATVAPLAAMAFIAIFRQHLAGLVAAHGWTEFLLLTVPTGLLWGGVQELLYRGLLQTALVQRLGAVAGVLIANLVFVIGPLHFYHFRLGTGDAPRWGTLAAVFGIGLFFGILYRRSGNLWIPALFHGMWPPNYS